MGTVIKNETTLKHEMVICGQRGHCVSGKRLIRINVAI